MFSIFCSARAHDRINSGKTTNTQAPPWTPSSLQRSVAMALLWFYTLLQTGVQKWHHWWRETCAFAEEKLKPNMPVAPLFTHSSLFGIPTEAFCQSNGENNIFSFESSETINPTLIIRLRQKPAPRSTKGSDVFDNATDSAFFFKVHLFFKMYTALFKKTRQSSFDFMNKRVMPQLLDWTKTPCAQFLNPQVVSSSFYHLTPPKKEDKVRREDLLGGLHLCSHADVVSGSCRTGLTLRRLRSSSALARATWRPCTGYRPLHVPPKFVTVPSCKVVLNPPPSSSAAALPPVPWRMAMHRCDCGHVACGRRVRTPRRCGGSRQPHQHHGQTLVAQSVLAFSLHRAGAPPTMYSDECSSVRAPIWDQI